VTTAFVTNLIVTKLFVTFTQKIKDLLLVGCTFFLMERMHPRSSSEAGGHRSRNSHAFLNFVLWIG
jgi:hypothetical protein